MDMKRCETILSILTYKFTFKMIYLNQEFNF